jgi:hypothetical protein
MVALLLYQQNRPLQAETDLPFLIPSSLVALFYCFIKRQTHKLEEIFSIEEHSSVACGTLSVKYELIKRN